MTPRRLKMLAVLGCLFLAALFYLRHMGRQATEKFAFVTVQQLRDDRNWALRSDVPQAAKILGYVREGTNMKQKPGSALDKMCSLERSNVIADIIVYLRTKTGEDLGDSPEPWIRKYATKD